ncbi:uncharacterized protein LOC121869617 [Homarus americanus]|uniref:Putative FR47-like protein domain-containing protein 6 n=1 Tax=Homarus americanus TaxID=6706 RepID=A0A8J5JX33_HOMAM|nr:uncharacterized protein LOC121869617 [Homarus americanus]XP_042227035.1 uncharacterized protein LOC121869617 [Homarus americanus]KAG7166232.1 putative FR47-like protein domain-containing protein 6 [Homarus americanus]
MMEGLREVNPEELPQLLKCLAKYLPHSVTVHGVVNMHLRYQMTEHRIFTPSQSSSTFVLTTMNAESTSKDDKKQSVSLFWDTEKEEEETVAELLSSAPVIDWTQPVFFFACAQHLLSKVEEMKRSGRVGVGRLMPRPMIPSHLFTITRDKLPAHTPRLPEGFRLGPINTRHAQHLCSHWEYRRLSTLENYTRVLATLPGYAVYPTQGEGEAAGYSLSGAETERDSGASGEGECEAPPVAWAHLSQVNTISNVFTLEGYRRLGLGGAATLALAAHLLQEEHRVSSYVNDYNYASIKFHEHLGFTKECPLGWQMFSPRDDASCPTSTP